METRFSSSPYCHVIQPCIKVLSLEQLNLEPGRDLQADVSLLTRARQHGSHSLPLPIYIMVPFTSQLPCHRRYINTDTLFLLAITGTVCQHEQYRAAIAV